MRWPFFFGRGSATTASHGPEHRAPIREWETLPAIQRVVGEPELTAPAAAFVHSLAGTHDPDLSLAPLGHHVSLDAPPGLVSGLAQNVDTYAPSHELVSRPRARREAPVQRQVFDSEAATPAPAAAELDVPAPEPAAPSFAVIDEPVQVRAPLTHLADSEAGAVLRLATPRPPAETMPAPLHEASRAEAANEIVPRTVTAQRLTLGQSRRIGLGAPISKQTAATVQRSVDAAPLDLAPPPRASREHQTSGALPPELPASQTEGDEPATAAVERIAPIAGVTIQRRGDQSGDGEPYADLPLARGAGMGPVEPAPTPEPTMIQRVVATPLPPLLSRPVQLPTAPIVPGRLPLQTVRRTSDSGENGAASGGEAAGPMAIQRRPTIVAGESPASIAQPDAGQVVTPATYREVVTAATPSPRTALPLAPAVQRVTPAVQDFVAHSPFATPSFPQSARRATTVIDVPVQREVADEAPASEPSLAPASASPGAAAVEAPGQSDKELDELARKLHDRISLHLRRDLLIQRERAGMVTDLR